MQYRKFDWKYFDTKHFRVYHYDRQGRQLGRYVAEEAENDIAVVERKLGGRLPKKFNLVLYNSYEDYRQTNIGLKEESGLPENTRAGTLDLVDDKLVIYFTGKHTDIKHQILTGMATVLMQKFIFGENFKTVVKNALLLNLPAWVTQGFIAYLTDGWDAKTNSEWKSLLEARPKAGFHTLSEQYPELAGKAFWKFVSDDFGTAAVKNLLYSMQNKTSLNRAMKDNANLKMKVTKAYDSCMKFYKNTYASDALQRKSPDYGKGLISVKIPGNNKQVRNITLSPRGSDIAYVEWQYGMYWVYTQKTSNEQDRSLLLDGGEKDLTEQNDPNYPLLAYSNTGNKLAILFKRGAQIRMRIYNSQKGKVENFVIKKNRFDRVLGMAFTEDEDKLIFSAIKKSRSDLYLFTIKGTKMENITDDDWDDMAPVLVSGGSRKGILFLSNRPKPNLVVSQAVNELPTGQMNLFFYNLTTKSHELLQCTNNMAGNITQPVQYGYDNFAFLNDANGINNKYAVMFARDLHNKDSAYAVPVTDYASSILFHQYNLASNLAADVVQDKNMYKVYFHDVQLPKPGDSAKMLTPTTLFKEATADTGKHITTKMDFINRFDTPDEPETTPPQVKGGNAFQTEFEDTTPPPPPKKTKIKHTDSEAQRQKDNAADSSLLTVMTDSAYLKMKPTPYRLSFKADFVTARLDNSILFSQYQPYGNNNGQYINPSLGALSTLSLNELMDNHRFTIGFQLPLDLTGSTYFLQYQNFSKLIDWGVLVMHSQLKKVVSFPLYDPSGNYVGSLDYPFKGTMDMVQGDLSYPLSRVRSVKFHSSLRQEKMTPRAIDTISLYYLDDIYPTEYWSLSRLEYVFDNTVSYAENIRFGTRYKAYTEYMYKLNGAPKNCYNFGFDYRGYQRLYKNCILAFKAGYAHSDGNAEVQYQLGGTDNWLFPKQATPSIPPGNDAPGFMYMTSNLRGYLQQARQGNNFALCNTEIRLPVITTFLKRPIQSAFLKNLQWIAFADAGGAWYGFLPTADATNATYLYYNMRSVIKLEVPNGNGLAIGYGTGLRTTLFGYFCRLDFAWSIDGQPGKPVVYFSLGTDF